MRRPLAAIERRLDRHLHRHLDGDGAGIREEHVVEIARQQRCEPRREPRRRLVHQAAEHHVRHHLELPPHGGGDVGMIVAVAGGPPRGDAVDQHAAVLEDQARTLGGHDGQGRRRRLHLAVRAPQVRAPEIDPVGWRRGSRHRPVLHFAGTRARQGAMRSLDTYAAAKLDALEARALRRSLVETDRGAFPQVIRHGRRLISFSCNDYLGLSVDARVKTAAAAALDRWGAGAGASRLVTGNHPLHAGLERKLAAMKGSEAACLFGSGYLANVGVLGALAGPEDLVLIDALAHNCLNAGAALSGATLALFAHNDVEALADLLASRRDRHRHALIVTETVFSMDGDRAPLAALGRLAAGPRRVADGGRCPRLRCRRPRG